MALESYQAYVIVLKKGQQEQQSLIIIITISSSAKFIRWSSQGNSIWCECPFPKRDCSFNLTKWISSAELLCTLVTLKLGKIVNFTNWIIRWHGTANSICSRNPFINVIIKVYPSSPWHCLLRWLWVSEFPWWNVTAEQQSLLACRSSVCAQSITRIILTGWNYCAHGDNILTKGPSSCCSVTAAAAAAACLLIKINCFLGVFCWGGWMAAHWM